MLIVRATAEVGELVENVVEARYHIFTPYHKKNYLVLAQK